MYEGTFVIAEFNLKFTNLLSKYTIYLYNFGSPFIFTYKF